MKTYNLIALSIIIGITLITLVNAAYTAPAYTNVTIVLKSSYTIPTYTNFTIVLGELPTNCNPVANTPWIINNVQICNGVNIALGTGTINIIDGNLTLINGANITAKGLNITAKGDRVFVIGKSELRL